MLQHEHDAQGGVIADSQLLHRHLHRAYDVLKDPAEQAECMTATTQGAGRHGQPPTPSQHGQTLASEHSDDQAVEPGIDEKIDASMKTHTYPPQDDASTATNKASDDEQDETEKSEHMRLRDMKGQYSYHKREHWWWVLSRGWLTSGNSGGHPSRPPRRPSRSRMHRRSR